MNENDNDHIYFSVSTLSPSSPSNLVGIQYTGVIPPGSYGEQDFTTALNTVLSTLSGGAVIATIDNNTSIVTITTTSPQATFRINTDAEVTKFLNISNPISIDEIILNTNDVSAVQTASSPYTIKRLNYRR